MNNQRRKIAGLARQLYKKEITFSEFLAGTPEQDEDDLIDELVDLIEHEPQKGGLLGIKESEHDKYIKQIFVLIERLERKAT